MNRGFIGCFKTENVLFNMESKKKLHDLELEILYQTINGFMKYIPWYQHEEACNSICQNLSNKALFSSICLSIFVMFT